MFSLIRSASDIDRLVTNKVPEGPALEYKGTLPLSTRDERREALKDLSGIGNGGGGTVVVGIEKDPQNAELPSRVAPLTDRGLVGRLEDIVRSGVRSPLLATYTPIEYGAGFVLVTDILRSPLGPYMVEGYDVRGYFMRSGSRTEPMTEQQVRDAYMLAARGRERRDDAWNDHKLPMPTAPEPWLLVSALPEEPLIDVLDLDSADPKEFTPTADLRAFSRMACVPPTLQFWAAGLHGTLGGINGQHRAFRLHRDGAVGFAIQFPNHVNPILLSRFVHAQLVYLAWLWRKLPIRTPIELDIQLRTNDSSILAYPPEVGGEIGRLQRPWGVGSAISASLRSEHLPSGLSQARSRHSLVWEFTHRVHQAFGVPRAADRMFSSGWLYGSDGAPADYYLVGGGLFKGLYGNAVGNVYEDGSIYRTRDASLEAYVVDGVVLDTSGNAIAATEMAVDNGLPDDFLVKEFVDAPCPDRLGPNPQQTRTPKTPPRPTHQWSGARLTDRFPYP